MGVVKEHFYIIATKKGTALTITFGDANLGLIGVFRTKKQAQRVIKTQQVPKGNNVYKVAITKI